MSTSLRVAHSIQKMGTIGLNSGGAVMCFTTRAWFAFFRLSSSASCCSLHTSHLVVLPCRCPLMIVHLENSNVDFLVLQPLQNHIPCGDLSLHSLHFPREFSLSACSHSPFEKSFLYFSTWQLMHVLVSKQSKHTRVWVAAWCSWWGRTASSQNHSKHTLHS